MLGFPNWPMGFRCSVPKNDQHLGCEMGKPTIEGNTHIPFEPKWGPLFYLEVAPCFEGLKFQK